LRTATRGVAGICSDDAKDDMDWLVNRLLGARLWPEPEGEGRQWRTNVVDLVGPDGKPGQVLLVSQFTLYGSLKTNKPDYRRAMGTEPAREMFDEVVARVCKGLGGDTDRVATGSFGAMMDVALVNDGPVTLMLDSRNKDNLDLMPRSDAPQKKKSTKSSSSSSSDTVADTAAAAVAATCSSGETPVAVEDSLRSPSAATPLPLDE
jgi:D-aminoacyl-tRNA deacylase